MAENKKAVLMYADWLETFEELTDEEAGRLVKHLWRYINDLNPEEPDRTTKLAFGPMKRSLKRDLKKWEEIRQKRVEAGKASADKRKQMPTSVDMSGQVPTVSVSVNVNDSVSVFHKADLDLKFENLKKDKYVKESYAKYNYSTQQWDQLIADLYQNCLEKQYSEPYTDLVKYLSNYRKTWKPEPQTKQTYNHIK